MRHEPFVAAVRSERFGVVGDNAIAKQLAQLIYQIPAHARDRARTYLIDYEQEHDHEQAHEEEREGERESHSHDLVAAIGVNDLAGDRCGTVAGEKNSCRDELRRITTPFQWRALLVILQHGRKPADATSSECL